MADEYFLVKAFVMFAVGTHILFGSRQSVANAYRKLKLVITGLTHMLLSRDKRFKPKVDPGTVEVEPTARGKRVIFIRHGESEWNEVFNRGFGPSFLVRLVKAVIREVSMLGTRDSVFFDSPLSETGIHQTQELIRFLHKEQASVSPQVAEAVAVLRGGGQAGSSMSDDPSSAASASASAPSTSSVLAASNLRRAIATGTIALWERLVRTKERFLVHSLLQEVTINVDGISLLEHGEVPDPTLSRELGGEVAFDAEFNDGTKGLSSNGLRRMEGFAEWACSRPEDTVIAVGHSLYFRSFFKAFLPWSSSHICKKKKMVNCGVVAFTLYPGLHGGQTGYRIDEDSVLTVYGGFK